MTETHRALAFHAEALHDDHVWARLQPVLRLMAARNTRATFFVSPFWARAYGRELEPRVTALISAGHEVGQHTHFYRPDVATHSEKENDLSVANLVERLRADNEWLRAVGDPVGFTSGAWIAPNEMYPVLAELGFDYDCSARTLQLQPAAPAADTRFMNEPVVDYVGERAIALLPTTHTLKASLSWARGRRSYELGNGERYQIIYLHDYDLLKARVFAALCAKLVVSEPLEIVGGIARQVTIAAASPAAGGSEKLPPA